ncbi:PIN domain-containing protein [Treponema sp. Marseille-Q4523]|uniref:PIN domain-containing protein n=1 Tax=Treponema sp. Marseille-Q4523 TaxID=2810610 RepID=UPI00195F7755|nr:PIN domain-containing protein [Treponema sp. Marseille-Q4523]MBM7022469.1 PIN domain-containing protein [Treponema sp. Marseille-Q4523]
MILADTNIIIDFWNKPAVAAEKIFSENDIAICGVIKTELLRGSQSADDFAQIQMSLADFYYLNFAENDWVALAKQFITLKKHGLVVPFQDAMIAFLAIKYDCEVWTNDKHFKLMQTAIPQLKLFSPRK